MTVTADSPPGEPPSDPSRSDEDLGDLVHRAARLDKAAVAGLIGIFEDARPTVAARRSRAMELLERDSADGGATVIGITGSPGSGKSSLLSRLTLDLLAADPDLTIAVLAVDPSSQVSGGSLLGDRTRMHGPPDERRLFFRSQASATELGGLSPSSFQVCRLLARLFRCVMVETVGVGQSEADIRYLADHVYLVLQPLGGDEVQFLKAGIIEVPDAFVLNKCDEAAAATSYHHLRASLGMARPFDAQPPPVFRTSAGTGEGVAELSADVRRVIVDHRGRDRTDREAHFFERWVVDEWGRRGRAHLSDGRGAASVLADAGGFDAAQLAFDRSIRAALSRDDGD